MVDFGLITLLNVYSEDNIILGVILRVIRRVVQSQYNLGGFGEEGRGASPNTHPPSYLQIQINTV